MQVTIGTAGWSIPRAVADRFPAEGSSLERYAARFNAVEINSSFHRPHRAGTWQRWGSSVPAGFRFAVKLPKTITHLHKLAECDALLDAFAGEAGALGPALAVLLVQLPPSLAFSKPVAEPFFVNMKSRFGAAIACEPRHSSWFDPDADAMLADLGVARVAADPAICAAAAVPGGWRGLAYVRLHGSPRMYRSSYDDRLLTITDQLRGYARAADCWCMFDNTASSAATPDALALQALIEPAGS